jgi:hypothetical protein
MTRMINNGSHLIHLFFSGVLHPSHGHTMPY